MNNIAYYNGKISTIDDMTIPMKDRAVYFGDGVYDVAFIKDGRIFALDEHIQRFMNNCRLIEIDFNLTAKELERVFNGMLGQLDNFSDGMLYWQASRGTADREHVYPGSNVPANLLSYIKPKSFPDLTKGIKLITLPDPRYSLCHIKTINLIPNIMASEKAKKSGCDEAILIRDGRVTECSHSNISIIKNGRFITAPLDCYILPGIARGHVIEICGSLGIPVEQRIYTPEEMMEADEILVTSTTTLCRAACEIDNRPVGGKSKDTVRHIQDAYLKKIG
ncbi:MAG: aminotransferase class IV [Eubacteriales bacterium]|nr:aminotransferase class IV [Eubacteriales bacterium]